MNKNRILKRLMLLSVGALIIPTFATADIKMGIILGFTGPIESLTPDMGNSAELAFKEASDSGQLLGGQKIKVVRADSTCIDAAAATAFPFWVGLGFWMATESYSERGSNDCAWGKNTPRRHQGPIPTLNLSDRAAVHQTDRRHQNLVFTEVHFRLPSGNQHAVLR